MRLLGENQTQWRHLLTGLVALLISAVAALVAGVYLGTQRELLALIPALLILLPPSINMRGSISGVLASRLSSSMHLGGFSVNFSRTGLLGKNLRVTFAVTIIISFVLAVFAWMLGRFFGIEVLSPLDLVVISVISGMISGLIVMGVTLLIVMICFRKSIDLDMVAAPTVTTAGDLATLPILLITGLWAMELDPIIREYLFGGIAILLVIVAAYFLATSQSMKEIARELVPLLIVLSLVGTLAGVTYTLDLENLVTLPVFLILIPPFTGGCGSIAGILCSRLATGMHMGWIEPSVFPEKRVLSYFKENYIYAIVIFPVMALLASQVSGMMGLFCPPAVIIVLAILLAGLIVLTFTTVIAYSTAAVSFRYGLDPDNFGVPVITGVIDLIGAVVLVTTINILI